MCLFVFLFYFFFFFFFNDTATTEIYTLSLHDALPICAAFARAPDALAAAISAQRALHNENWGPINALRVRMALHTGVAEERNGDYFGPPLNRADRLMANGHG